MALLLVGSAAAAQSHLVQQNGVVGSDTGVVTGFPAPSTAGNTIIVLLGTASPGCSIVDGAGNTYVAAVDATGIGSFAGGHAQIQYAADIAVTPRPLAVRATCGGAELRILEYAGLDRNSPLDGTAVAAGTGPAADSGQAMVSTPPELLVGWVLVAGAALQAGAGFTSRSTFFGDMVMDRVAPASGAYSATAVVDNADWLAELATFKVDLTLDAGSPSVTTLVLDGGIQFVQSNAASTAGGDIKIPLLAPSLGGDTLIVAVYAASAMCTLNDSLGDVYVPAGPPVAGTVVYAGANLSMYSAAVAPGGGDLIVEVNCGAFVNAFITEYAGLAPVPFVESTSGESGSDAGILSAPLATDGTPELLLAYIKVAGVVADAGPGFSMPLFFDGDGVVASVTTTPGAVALNASASQPGWFYDYAVFHGLSRPDAGAADAGAADAGAPDAGAPDAGAPDAGVTSVAPRTLAVGCGCSSEPASLAFCVLLLLRVRRVTAPPVGRV
jgi:hypothetical protein